MTTFAELEQCSTAFFDSHWCKVQSEPPKWNVWTPFLKTPVVYYDKGSCYALFQGELLIYIGVGISKGRSANPNPAIARRLTAHVLRKDLERAGDWYKLQEK